MGTGLAQIAVVLLSMSWTTTTTTTAFQSPSHRCVTPSRSSSFLGKSTTLYARRTITKERSFDPLNIGSDQSEPPTRQPLRRSTEDSSSDLSRNTAGLATATALATLAAASDKAVAATNDFISQGTLNPENFQPVCPASDAFYRFLQSSTVTIVGEDNFVDYGPLIAGGLLRVRLELCVVESFFNEAVFPFIKENGLSWILPLHETVETFLAGVIFALATTFILIGSTKILTVIMTYTDFLLGVPSRLLGGFVFDRATGKPVTLDVGFGPFKTRVVGPPKEVVADAEEKFDIMQASFAELIVVLVSGAVRLVGQVFGFAREVLDAIDTFVGKYLVFWASFYVLIKFLHYRVIPDFP